MSAERLFNPLSAYGLIKQLPYANVICDIVWDVKVLLTPSAMLVLSYKARCYIVSTDFSVSFEPRHMTDL